MNRRRLALGVVGSGLVGAVFVAGDDVAAAVPVGDVVGALGNDYFLVVALAAASALLAAVVVERGDGTDQFRMPDPERTVSVPAPGDRLAGELDRWRNAVPLLGRETRRTVRERLRADAVEAVRRTENCDPDEARRRVASGRWTDESSAASFLTHDRRVPPVGTVVRAALRGETWFSRGARQTADEIARRSPDGHRPRVGDGGEEVGTE